MIPYFGNCQHLAKDCAMAEQLEINKNNLSTVIIGTTINNILNFNSKTEIDTFYSNQIKKVNNHILKTKHHEMYKNSNSCKYLTTILRSELEDINMNYATIYVKKKKNYDIVKFFTYEGNNEEFLDHYVCVLFDKNRSSYVLDWANEGAKIIKSGEWLSKWKNIDGLDFKILYRIKMNECNLSKLRSAKDEALENIDKVKSNLNKK